MSYADFAYYKETYLGGMVEGDFSRLARRASAYLDRVTDGRIADADAGTMARVRDACCAVAEEYRLTEQGGEVSSVSNDGYAVEYVAGVTKSKTPEQRLYAAAALYLGGTDLLYRGV